MNLKEIWEEYLGMFEEKNINEKILQLKNSKILKNSVDKDY